MSFALTIGGREYRARLPGALRRYALVAEFDEDSTPARRIAAAVACVALALDAPPCPLPDYRAHGGDVFAFGEACADALDAAGVQVPDVISAGLVVAKRINDSFPTAADIGEASDPTGAHGEGITSDAPDLG